MFALGGPNSRRQRIARQDQVDDLARRANVRAVGTCSIQISLRERVPRQVKGCLPCAGERFFVVRGQPQRPLVLAERTVVVASGAK